MKDKKKADNQTYYVPIGMRIGSLNDARNRKNAKDVSKYEDTE